MEHEIGSKEWIGQQKKWNTVVEDERHAEMVKALVKSGDVLKSEITKEKLDLWIMGCQMLIEAGNLFDCIKKHVIYNKEFNGEVFSNHIAGIKLGEEDLLNWPKESNNGCLDEINPTGDQLKLLHMVSCRPGEASELLEMVLKHVVFSHTLDMENAKEELGDSEFYDEGTRDCLKLTRKECLENNWQKLNKRYEGMKYSDKAAHERADKK